jgi:threonyl-tRNA synthetase
LGEVTKWRCKGSSLLPHFYSPDFSGTQLLLLLSTDEFELTFAAKAKKRGLRVETDLRNEKINYKVREDSLAKILALMAVGRKEASENTVSVRHLGSSAQSRMGAHEAIAALAKEAMPPDLREGG